LIEHKPDRFDRRLKVITLVFGLAVLVLWARLWDLQIVQGHKFRSQAQHNRIRLIPIKAPRGTIFDSRGNILADNRPSFCVSINPDELERGGSSEHLQVLGEILNMAQVEIAKKLAKCKGPFDEMVVADGVDLKQVTLLEEHQLELPGVDTRVQPRRHYTNGRIAAHLIGYLGEINHEELRKLRLLGYKLGDVVGKTGIEKVCDEFLRGTDGGKQLEVNAHGEVVSILGYKRPCSGNNVVLTIDSSIQGIVEDALGHRAGTIIVMDVHNGQILAWASHPSFDPNDFVFGISYQDWQSLLDDSSLPLTNRAIQGRYPPGSIFKIVTAIAALQEGVIGPNDLLDCSGTYQVGEKIYRCWKPAGHGQLNIEQAIVHSCDVFFYQLGQRVGVHNLASAARECGLGRPTGVNLPGEEPGLIPTSRWKIERLGERWYGGDTINMSIGQGYLLVTPLQVVNLFSAMANGGILYRPQLISCIVSPEGKTIESIKPQVVGRISLSATTLEILRRALWGAVNEAGTGWRARVPSLGISGKTGTAQNPRGQDHAWFGAYAPDEDPRIAMVVFLEHGGHGGPIATPIAGRIFREIFEEILSNEH